MKIILILLLISLHVSAIETSKNLFECSKIFQERKGELLVELERIDEQRQALEALQYATDDLITKREAAIEQREANVSAVLSEITAKEASIKKMLDENKQALETMKNLKMDKTSQTFAKMKAGSAAQVLSEMKIEDAAKIMMTLKPKTVGKILSKMDAQKASAITLKLTASEL
ncbi:MAG: PDP protein [Campylobacterota bacterium]|nr:PDP protein [Campylobacterota bacterium]